MTFNELKDRVIEAVKQAGKEFIVRLWELLKNDIIVSAKQSLELLKELIKSEAGQMRKAFIVDIIMDRITLPVILKPFRGIIKKLLADKIEEAVIGLIERGQEFIG